MVTAPQQYPIPVLDTHMWRTTYAPVVGDTRRRFWRMDQACDYQVGAHACLQGMGLHSEANQLMLDGWSNQERILVARSKEGVAA